MHKKTGALLKTRPMYSAALAGAMGALTLPLFPADAQTAATATPPNNPGLSDIVVTARRRSESLQNVPVAVIALNPTQLQNNVATDLNKVAELAPQVIIGRASSGTGAILTIRGISSSAADSGLDQSVSVSMDNVPLSRGRIISATLFDVQQVQILQGPQALFFGKNSPAGVISIDSADPKSFFEGYAKAGYEFNAHERFVEGAVSIPLTDTLALRLAGRYDYMDGWIKNVAKPIANPFQPSAPLPGEVDGSTGPRGSDAAIRVTLRWAPTSDFTAKLKVLYDRQHLNSNGAFSEGYCIGGLTVPTELGVPMPNADCKKDMSKAESGLPSQFTINYPGVNGGVPYDHTKFAFVSLNMNKTMGDMSLTSTTGYYNQTHAASDNADYTPFAQIWDVESEHYTLLTQELRLDSNFSGPLNFMVGAYGEHATRNWFNAPDLFNAYDPVHDNYLTTIQKTHSINNSFSFFAQARWKIVPRLELSGGARVSSDDKRTSFINVENNLSSATGRSLYPQGVPLSAHSSGDNVSPEVTLTWKPSTYQTLYAAYKTGYKAGGISNAGLLPASATSQSVKFGAEKTHGFEVGYKADLLDHHLRLDLVAYRYRYNGLQVTSFDPVLILYRVNNAASARTEGVTASFNWLATHSLSFDGNIGYNRARYLSFRDAQCYSGQTAALGCVNAVQDLSGKPLNRAPDVTFSLGADYKRPIPAGWTADLSVNGTHSSSYQAETDYAPGGLQDAFWRLNAAIHFTSPDSKFDVAVVGRNLTNSYYLVSATQWPGVGNANEYVGVFNRPREVVLQGTVNF